jgi:hypothetical protein
MLSGKWIKQRKKHPPPPPCEKSIQEERPRHQLPSSTQLSSDSIYYTYIYIRAQYVNQVYKGLINKKSKANNKKRNNKKKVMTKGSIRNQSPAQRLIDWLTRHSPSITAQLFTIASFLRHQFPRAPRIHVHTLATLYCVYSYRSAGGGPADPPGSRTHGEPEERCARVGLDAMSTTL